MDSDGSKLAFPKVSRFSFGAMIAILFATVVLYSTTIGDYFLGDDFVHLPWLLKASHDPSMVLKSFTTSWLDVVYVQFYRPLISVSFFTDYLIWGANAIGYHLSNLLYHLISAVAVFLITRNVNRALVRVIEESDIESYATFKTFLRSDWLPLVSTAMFAFYAIHPEAVVWIVGRTDGLCAMFILLALWCYTQAQFLRSKKWTATTLISFALALVSKEMAIPTPALFFAYSFLFPVSMTETDELEKVGVKSPFSLTEFFTAILKALRATVPYWILLALYFCVRRMALGTFIGGYDNSLFLAFPLPVVLHMWAGYLSVFCVPINGDLLSHHSPLRFVWLATIIISPLLALFIARSRRPVIRLLAFYCAWLLISFVPIFKAFFLNETLQGGRLVYLASAPFSVLIVIGWTLFAAIGKIQKNVAAAVLVVMLAISAYFLWANNSAWAEAGAESKAIELELHKLFKDDRADPMYFFCGIPNDVHGAWLGINAFEGMTKQPRMSRDLQHTSCMIPADRVTPFGFLRDDYSKLGNEIHIFCWDMKEKQFHQLTLPKDNKDAHDSWKREEFIGADGKSLNLIAASSNVSNSAHVDIDFANKGLQCFNANILEFAVTVLSVPANSSAQFTKLRFRNEVQNVFDESSQETQLIQPFLGSQNLLFPMRENVNWWLGGSSPQIRLTFPPGWCVRIDRISTEHGDNEIPAFRLAATGGAPTIGTFLLTPQKPSVSMLYDVSHIPGAKGGILEMTRPNTPFESHNSPNRSLSTEKSTVLSERTGTVKLDKTMLDGPGIYQFRVRATNALGATVGFASDHIVVIAEKGI